MPEYIVTFTSMLIEADDEEDAIARACEFKGGGNWEAEPQPRNVTSNPDGSRSEPRFRLYSLCPCPVCENTGKDAVGDRCEQCRGEGKQRVRIAEADTPQALGLALVTCAREGAWPDGCQFGLLDQEGDVGLKWLVRPWQASPTARNAADAARVLAGKRWK